MPAASPLVSANTAAFGRIAGLAFAAVVVLPVLAWLSFRPTNVTAVVAGKEWHRVIYTERLSTLTEEGWRVPSGASSVDSFPAVIGYRAAVERYQPTTRRERDRVDTRVRRCGQDYLSRDLEVWKLCADSVRTPHAAPREYRDAAYRPEPLYRMRYRYLASRWAPDETLWKEGTTERPAWPELGGRSDLRASSQQEWYEMTFTDAEGRLYSQRMFTAEEFVRFGPGDRVRLRVWRGGAAEVTGAAQ